MEGLAPEIEVAASQVLAALRARKLAYVEGPVGSGRNVLVERLSREHDIVAVDLLPLSETDAPAAALLELASHLPAMHLPSRRGAEPELHHVGRAIGAALRALGKAVVLRVPESWRKIEDVGKTDDVVPARAAALLHGLFADGSVALVADAAVTPERLGFHAALRVPLRPHVAALSTLESLPWGPYLPALNALLTSNTRRLRSSPLAWRLAIGAVALGEPVGVVERLLTSTVPIPPLAHVLARRIRHHPLLSAAVMRFLAVRRPIARSAIAALTSIQVEHTPLLTMCIGYGRDMIRVTPLVRRLLSARLSESKNILVRQTVHEALADHYRKSDGARSPVGLGTPQTLAWCEKVHHLAHSGPAGADEWAEQDIQTPELYWDRARYLSRVSQDYAGAASVYRTCSERFPDDDYAWHYYAYNLARSGRKGPEVEKAYRTAVGLAEENPWWNSRLVTFLSADGQPNASHREWRAAIERVDPDGEIVRANMWLARHFHRWVFREWAGSGRAKWAGEVYGLLPERIRATGAWRFLHRQQDGARRDWASFLANLESRLQVSEEMANHVRRHWVAIADLVVGEMPLPMVDLTADGASVQIAWSYRNVLLEIEVHASGTLEWFAKDRSAGTFEEGNVLDDRTKAWLESVVNA